MNKTIKVQQKDKVVIIKAEDVGIERYDGRYFVLDSDCLYGFFYPLDRTFSKGEILDKYGIIVKI